MNTEKRLAASKNRRSRRQKNKYSKYTVKKTDDQNQSTSKQTKSCSEDESSESDEKYSKRKVESNWSRYDETDENINDNLNEEIVKIGATNKKKGSKTSNGYVPIEILSSQEINKQLKVLPAPKPPRSALGRGGVKKDTSVEDAAFWFGDLPIGQQNVKLEYGNKKDSAVNSNVTVENSKFILGGIISKPQRQPKIKFETNTRRTNQWEEDITAKIEIPPQTKPNNTLIEEKTTSKPQRQRPAKKQECLTTATTVIADQDRNNNLREQRSTEFEQKDSKLNNNMNVLLSEKMDSITMNDDDDKHQKSSKVTCSPKDNVIIKAEPIKSARIDTASNIQKSTNKAINDNSQTCKLTGKAACSTNTIVDQLTFKSSDLRNKVNLGTKPATSFQSIKKQNTKELESWLDDILND